MNIRSALQNALVAATITLASVVANAATVTYVNQASSVDRGGVYSGFYNLTIDTASILGMCDSRFSTVSPPTTWTADVWTYADIQGGAIGKFSAPVATAASLKAYSQVGWLFSQIGTLSPTDYNGQADIQEAIWSIMAPLYSPAQAYTPGTIGLPGGWYAAATGGTHDAYDWSADMRVVTADPLVQGDNDVQEFLIGPGMSVVPVPAAAWLFGSALVGLGGLVRRRVTH